MARLTRIESSDKLSSKEIGSSTARELEGLKKIIGDEKNHVDNINFSEKFQNKNLKNAEAFDRAADVLFDNFVLNNWKDIKHILALPKTSLSAEGKTKIIQEKYTNFLKNIPEDKVNGDYGTAIIIFKNTLENINKEKLENKQNIIELADLELNILKDEIITLSSGRFSSTHPESPFGDWKKEKTIEEDKTSSDNKKQRNEKENINNEVFVIDEKTKIDNKNKPITQETINEKKRETGNYKQHDDFVDNYDQTVSDYHNTDNPDLLGTSEEKNEDIYNDKRVAKVLEKIFDKDELKARHFKINLTAEDGLARIILDIKKIAINKGIKIDNKLNLKETPNENGINTNENKTDIDVTIFSLFQAMGMIPNDASEMTKKDTIAILEKLKIPYKKDGVLGDYRRLTKLFNYANRGELSAFADLIQSRTDIARVTKERYNNKKILENETDIDNNNVFTFLSDLNSDGIVSADKDKKNKEQFKYGDLGNISGQQLLFTLNQAINTQSALLKSDIEGEKIVVKNITRMVNLMVREQKKDPTYLDNYDMKLGQDVYSQTYQEKLAELANNPTKTNLIKILKDYPQTKTLFLAAVEKVTGGSSINQTDLYDVLTGQEAKRLQQIDITNEKEGIRKALDLYLRKNPDIQKIIEKNGSIEIRETLLQQIMEKVDDLALQISFDVATDHDMIMSEVSKTFYREQAKKTILGDINIQQVSLGTNLNELKVSYQIGNSHISSDGRSKYQIAGGPAFYLGKDGKIGAGLEANFSAAEQTNYNQVISAPLSSVQNAHYLGVEGGAGAKIQNDGVGIYALLGVSSEKDALMGIYQLEKSYQTISNRLFDIQGLKNFDANSIEGYLNTQISSLAKGPYRDFVHNNENRLKEDVRFVVKYLETSGVLKEINKTSKTPEEKQEAISSFLRIVQQGNIDQWKGDIIMNLNSKLTFTKFSAGLSAGTWFFGTKSDNYKGTSTTGTSTDIPTNNDDPITEETDTTGSSANNGGETRLSFLGVYVGARLSTWKNEYLPNAKQVLVTEQEMNKGMIDQIEAGKDLGVYAKYLEGLFNKTDLHVSVLPDNKLKIIYTPTDPFAPSLNKILNIHYLPGKEQQFILKGNMLIIGNVGPIAAYTTTLPGGVDRVLCLGTKNLNEAIRVGEANEPLNDVSGIKLEKNGFENLNKIKIDGTIDLIKNGSKALSDTEKTFYKSLFDNDGKLIAPKENITYTKNISSEQQFSTGTLTLYKNSDGKYILDYRTSTDNKLHFAYKSIIETKVTKVQKIDFDQKLDKISLPNMEDVADLETTKIGNTKTIKTAFQEFTKAVTQANFDDAAIQLDNLLPDNDIRKTTLKNGSEEEKLYIIDNYVSLFAYEKAYKGKSLDRLFKNRGELFINHQGPGKENFSQPLKKDLLKIRKQFIDTNTIDTNTNKKNTYESLLRVTSKNIFGYTAFYRHGLENCGYAATTLGNTNIIEKSVTSVENQIDAKTWIIKNLENDPKHLNLLIQQVQKAINDSNISKYLSEGSQKEKITKLGKLIKNGELEIPNDNSQDILDISHKKIKLNGEAVFYLLGECVNESVGLRINEISIEENTDTYEGETTTDERFVSNLFGRSNSISGDIRSERYDVSIKGHKKLGEKTKDKTEEYKGDGNPGEGTDIPTEGDDGEIQPE